MIAKLRHWWQETRASFWFVPAVIVLAAVGLATLLIGVDASVELHAEKSWPHLFGAGAAGSRGLLTAVAGSMITVAGVVFSITIVALALTSSQYTSRVLRNFMSDPTNQTVLGVFVGIFAYCLVVLRTIRGGDEGAFVPSLAVIGALVLAFVGIGYLILFIHHIAVSIQAASIVESAAQETIIAVDHLFPEGLGDSPDEDAASLSAGIQASHVWSVVHARTTGYIESVDGDALLRIAREHQTIVRMERGIGEFVIEGTPLVSVASDAPDDDMAAELNEAYVISRQRTVQQDAAFGIRQIVDIALKALSPGVNDTTTAVICVEYLAAILVRLAPRRISPSLRLDEDELRVIARGPSFESLLSNAFDQIRQNAAGNVTILQRLLWSLEQTAERTDNPKRRQFIGTHARLIAELAGRSISCQQDRAGIDAGLERLAKLTAAKELCLARKATDIPS